jgi:arylformamidase
MTDHSMHTEIIDLTQPLNERTRVYPGTARPEFEVVSSVDRDGYKETLISMLSHTGTHIDAPCHILKSGRSLDEFPLEKFSGKATVISCTGRQEISLDFLKSFETGIREVDFLLFFTGWQDKWHTGSYFDDCPVPTRETALWLTGFPLKGIGFDAFSVDKIGSAGIVSEENLPNHFIFLRKEILLIENLCNLDKLPGGVFRFQCFPLKLDKADGSPVRAVGLK